VKGKVEEMLVMEGKMNHIPSAGLVGDKKKGENDSWGKMLS